MRRTALLAALTLTVGLLAPTAAGAAAPAPVRNGDLLVPITVGMVLQEARSSTYTPVADTDTLHGLGRISPDGASVAYSSNGALWVQDLATRARRQVTTDATREYGRPSWSPDGSQLTFTSGTQVRVVDVATRVQRVVLTAEVPLADADWSRDGTRIAYSTGDSVRVVRPDGSGVRTVFTGARSTQPDWSPDSRRLALITRAFDGDSEVVVVSRSGASVVRVSEMAYPQGYWHQGVAWSPDGRKLAVLQANKNGPPDDVDSDERQKVRAYAPDGSRSWTLLGPIYGDDAPLYLDWAPRRG